MIHARSSPIRTRATSVRKLARIRWFRSVRRNSARRGSMTDLIRQQVRPQKRPRRSCDARTQSERSAAAIMPEHIEEKLELREPQKGECHEYYHNERRNTDLLQGLGYGTADILSPWLAFVG